MMGSGRLVHSTIDASLGSHHRGLTSYPVPQTCACCCSAVTVPLNRSVMCCHTPFSPQMVWCRIRCGTCRNAPTVCRAAAAVRHNKTARFPMRDSVLYNPFSCLLVEVSTAALPHPPLVSAVARAKVAITSPYSVNRRLLSLQWHSSLATTGPLSGLPAQVTLATRENLWKRLPEPFSWFCGQKHKLWPSMDT